MHRLAEKVSISLLSYERGNSYGLYQLRHLVVIERKFQLIRINYIRWDKAAFSVFAQFSPKGEHPRFLLQMSVLTGFPVDCLYRARNAGEIGHLELFKEQVDQAG